MPALADRDIIILKALRERVNGNDCGLLDNVINRTITPTGIQRVCEIINDEYLMKGIEEGYSPNEYGRELEALLNKINALRLA